MPTAQHGNEESRHSDRAVRALLLLVLAFAVVRLVIGVRQREPFDIDHALALAFGLLAAFLLGTELHDAWNLRFTHRANRRNIGE